MIKTEWSEFAAKQIGALQPNTYPKMDAKIAKQLNFALKTLDKIMNRASGILSCGIYYDDLIQVKSLYDDQVCMILIPTHHNLL